MLFCQAMYEVDLGTYGPLASRWGLLDLLDNVFGRAVEIGCFDDLAAALWMHQYFYTRVLGSRFGDLLNVEAHVRRAVTFPEDNARALDLLVGIICSHRVFGIPYSHLFLRYAVLERGVTPQVFVGEE